MTWAGTATLGNPGDPVAQQSRWLAERRYLNAHRQELTHLASDLYPGIPRLSGSASLLTRAGWAPAQPVPLDEITLAWADPPVPAAVTGGESETADIRPLRATGHRYAQYSAAVAELDPPRAFENRPVYRLIHARFSDTGSAGVTRSAGVGEPGAGQSETAGTAGMTFTMGAYFDGTDVGEAVAHELAGAVRAGRVPALAGLPLRRLVGDPTDPSRRPMPVAITTLTIRYDRARGEARFLAHWRDPARVATNGGMYTVVPVGVFQPAGNAPTTGRDATSGDAAGDFNLWRGMAREYHEELLGAAEHVDVDYAGWPFFAELEQARRDGGCHPYCLGIGVDPLTLAVDVLTVTVFEAAAFDGLFAGLVEQNDEGRIVTRPGDGSAGIPFTAEEVHRLVAVEPTQQAGAALLAAAWQMREPLLSR